MIYFCRHPVSLKIRIFKVQDFGNFELSPMQLIYQSRQIGQFIFLHNELFLRPGSLVFETPKRI